MRLEQSKLQKLKIITHAVQAVAIFVALCITFSILSKSTHSDGRVGWYLALCFLSIPAIIYLAVVPMWSRSIRFANVYAFMALDILFALCWLSAFASMLGWSKAGIKEGAKEKKEDNPDKMTCAIFGYGSESACHLSYSAVVFGVIVFLTFLVTSTWSVLYFQAIRKNPNAGDPWLQSAYGAPSEYSHNLESGPSGTKDPIWDDSTREIDNPFHHDDDENDDGPGRRSADAPHDPFHDRNTAYSSPGSAAAQTAYNPIHSTDTSEGRHPGKPWGAHVDTAAGAYGDVSPIVETEYRGANRYEAPSALSPLESRDEGRKFNAGYSFSGAGTR